MRFSISFGLAAVLAVAAAQEAVVTDVDVTFATELVYVNGAGNTLSEAMDTPSSTTPVSSYSAVPTTTTTTTTPAAATPASPDKEPSAPAYTPTTFQTSVYTTPQAPPAYQTTTSTTTTQAPSQATGGCMEPSAAFADAANSCSGASNATYCERALGVHNLHRSNHSASPLTWSTQLEQFAKQDAANCIAQDYGSTNGVGHGSNMYITTGWGDAEDASEAWYSEVDIFTADSLYGLEDITGSTFEAVGHFTAMVWKTTASVGCATQFCPTTNNAGFNNAMLTLCYYIDEVGNVSGEYNDNVGDSLNCAAGGY